MKNLLNIEVSLTAGGLTNSTASIIASCVCRQDKDVIINLGYTETGAANFATEEANKAIKTACDELIKSYTNSLNCTFTEGYYIVKQ